MSPIVVVLVIYLVLLFGLAAWSRQESHSLLGYFLAGRRLPPWVVAFSTNATGESAWLLLGMSGMAYVVGVQALWVMLGEVLGISMAWLLVARRFKRLADGADAITVPDAFVARFGDVHHLLRGISVIVILVMVTAYVAAQMVASGKAFGSFMNMDYSAAVLLGAAITIAYTCMGGYKAVAYTDLLQGVLMLGGLILIPAFAIPAAGGWEGMLSTLKADEPRLLSIMGGENSGIATWVLMLSFLAIGIPFMGVPQLLVRFMSARAESEIKQAAFISVVVLIGFQLGAVLTGLAGRALVPGLDDPETILPVLSGQLFSPVISGLLLVTVLAAIMSTADSLLLLASSAVVRDFMQKIRGSARSDAELAHYGKVVTIAIGLIAVAFALTEAPLIFWFVLFAWSGLGAAFGPVVLCAIFDRRSNVYGAIAGMLGGFLTDMAWVLWFKEHSYDLYEIIPAFFVGITLMMVVSRRTAARKPD